MTCPYCDGDGYTETFNDDQNDVIVTLCTYCEATGKVLTGDPNQEYFTAPAAVERVENFTANSQPEPE